MIKIPAAILNSLDKNNNIFPTAEAVAPRTINTSENPTENKTVLITFGQLYLVVFITQNIKK